MMLIQLDDWVMMIENQLTKGSCHMALINGLEEKEKRERFS